MYVIRLAFFRGHKVGYHCEARLQYFASINLPHKYNYHQHCNYNVGSHSDARSNFSHSCHFVHSHYLITNFIKPNKVHFSLTYAIKMAIFGDTLISLINIVICTKI